MSNFYFRTNHILKIRKIFEINIFKIFGSSSLIAGKIFLFNTTRNYAKIRIEFIIVIKIYLATS
jgi:hypothetical protein